MNRLKNTFIAMSVFSILFGCSQSKAIEGGLYYNQNKDGTYSVLKILKIDDRGVHVKLYSNQYPTPPTNVDEETLYMAGINSKPNETLGMEHLPLSNKSYQNLKATLFQQSTVKDEDLEGYKMWLSDKGGYF
jgi:hypothetical protein